MCSAASASEPSHLTSGSPCSSCVCPQGDEEEGGEGAEPQAKRQKVPGAGVQLYGSHIAVSVGGLGDDDEEEEEEDDE